MKKINLYAILCCCLLFVPSGYGATDDSTSTQKFSLDSPLANPKILPAPTTNSTRPEVPATPAPTYASTTTYSYSSPADINDDNSGTGLSPCDPCRYAPPPPDMPCGDSYKLHCHFRPCYYYTTECEYIPEYRYEQCCRYIKEEYYETRTQMVPQYYTEIKCRMVPSFVEELVPQYHEEWVPICSSPYPLPISEDGCEEAQEYEYCLESICDEPAVQVNCIYVPEYYEETYCREVPEYYEELCCRYVPQYYYVCHCEYVPRYSYKKQCEYVTQYYYKQDKCAKPCSMTMAPCR